MAALSADLRIEINNNNIRLYNALGTAMDLTANCSVRMPDVAAQNQVCYALSNSDDPDEVGHPVAIATSSTEGVGILTLNLYKEWGKNILTGLFPNLEDAVTQAQVNLKLKRDRTNRNLQIVKFFEDGTGRSEVFTFKNCMPVSTDTGFSADPTRLTSVQQVTIWFTEFERTIG